MFSDEEKEFVFDHRHSLGNLGIQAQDTLVEDMDIVQHSIVHDVDESARSMAGPTPGSEQGQTTEGPRKISPRPWLMAPKNLPVSRVVALPVTAVTAAALIFYSRDSFSAGAAKFEDMRRAEPQFSVRNLMISAKSNMAEKLSSTRFQSPTTSFAQLHVANPSWDRL